MLQFLLQAAKLRGRCGSFLEQPLVGDLLALVEGGKTAGQRFFAGKQFVFEVFDLQHQQLPF